MIKNINIAPDAYIDPTKINGVVPMANPFAMTYYVQSVHTSAADQPAAQSKTVAAAGGTVEHPFATLDYAIGQCVANRGDLILLGPGHAEALATAAGCVLDVAGVDIMGIGNGTLMPKFTFTENVALISFAAANLRLSNVWLECDKTGAAHAKMLSVAANHVTIDNCYLTEGAEDEQTLVMIAIEQAIQHCRILNCKAYQIADAGDAVVSFVDAAGDQSHCEIAHNEFVMDADDAIISKSGAQDPKNASIHHNRLSQLKAATKTIAMAGATGGYIGYNAIASLVDPGIADADAIIDASACRCTENYAGDDDVDTSGILVPPATA